MPGTLRGIFYRGYKKLKISAHVFFTNKQSTVYILRYVCQSFLAQRSAPHSAALVDGGLLLFIGRCFRFLLSSQVCRKEARLFEIFRCRDPKERQVEGCSDASCSLAWAVPFVKIKSRVCGDVSIGKAEHPSTPELRKISIWRRFLSFAG